MSRIKKKFGNLLGLDKYFWTSRPNGLYSVNFHRIGDSADTQFDPCVYSCSTKELEQHLTFFKKHFRIISLSALSEYLRTNETINERVMCITFDDGYIDNYSNALPILKSLNVTASFFIATGLIGNTVVPWWDKVAYLLKTYDPKAIKLSGWSEKVINHHDGDHFIRAVLASIKHCKSTAQEQIKQLEAYLNHSGLYPAAEFMDWSHLQALIDNGMELGAHSHNHDILTKLTTDELFYELSHSKALLESNLQCKISAFSYPVGNRSTYDDNVVDGLKNNGYELAFNFQSGINQLPSSSPYDLHRFPIAPGMSEADLMQMFGYARKF